MNSLFRIVAHLEGWSFLILLCIAMPLKYIFNTPQLIFPVGMAHGVLFIGYIILALVIGNEQKWSFIKKLTALAVSVIPLGTFWFVRKYKN